MVLHAGLDIEIRVDKKSLGTLGSKSLLCLKMLTNRSKSVWSEDNELLEEHREEDFEKI